jgi:hypothetical protein
MLVDIFMLISDHFTDLVPDLNDDLIKSQKVKNDL